jgi:hypothetical protein
VRVPACTCDASGNISKFSLNVAALPIPLTFLIVAAHQRQHLAVGRVAAPPLGE